MSDLKEKFAEEFEEIGVALNAWAMDLRERLPQRKMSEAEEIGEIILLAKREGWGEDFMDISAFFNLKSCVFSKK